MKWYGTHTYKPNGEWDNDTFNGSDETVQVVLHTIVSVNQLSIYGAVLNWCEELALEFSKCSEGTGRHRTIQRPW